ncbi:MAG: SDR family oxidoreductase [Desulfobacterales bacterium]|nr:SDR family oxidoreductase [Desulfobacterales bacterium]MDJ0855490.1 SDR family oxidoreductase [Desulfobacterales bacterium]MDJ0886011.1 SDR family oxidoreductase [Desulfobacterales bacterium]
MKDRQILVVGGRSGIGRAVVDKLAPTQCRLDVVGRSDTFDAAAPNVTYHACDLSGGGCQFDFLPDKLHGVVYCPGTIRLKPLSRLTEADFLEDWQTNLMGAVRVLQACQNRLKKAREGASVVLFSTVAVAAGMPFHASIASAKGAVEGLMRSLAAEWAPRVRVNCIAPSLTDTPLAAGLLDGEAKRKAAAERHPLKRIGSAAETADLAVFLLGDSSAWITGQVIGVDGGVSSLRFTR